MKNIDFTKNKYAIEDKGLCNNNLFHHKGKSHPSLLVVFEAQGAAVEADDLARDGEADARAVGFGREEWCEDIFGHLGRDCGAVVGYLNLDAFLCVNR